MARRASRTLTEVELEFMQAVWERGEVTSDDLRRGLAERGRALADGSVRKVLGILVRKGYLERRRDGRGFLYRAVVEKAKARRSIMTDLLDRVFGGSSALLVASLLDEREVRPRDVAAIKRLIAGYERGKKK